MSHTSGLFREATIFRAMTEWFVFADETDVQVPKPNDDKNHYLCLAKRVRFDAGFGKDPVVS